MRQPLPSNQMECWTCEIGLHRETPSLLAFTVNTYSLPFKVNVISGTSRIYFKIYFKISLIYSPWPSSRIILLKFKWITKYLITNTVSAHPISKIEDTIEIDPPCHLWPDYQEDGTCSKLGSILMIWICDKCAQCLFGLWFARWKDTEKSPVLFCLQDTIH